MTVPVTYMRHLGFREEGIMRDAIYRDGAYHSLVLMSLLESEYREGWQ